MKKILLFLTMLMVFIAPQIVRAQETLTIYENGTATSTYVPVHGIWADAYLKCEFVVPADELADMTGGTISQMDFYLTTPAAAAWTGTFQVFLMEVDAEAISAYYGPSNATVVYTGQLDGTQSIMTVAFTDNYTYSGGNLLVGVYQTAKGNYKSCTFAGETVNNSCVQGYNSSSLESVTVNQRNFIPKTTFTFTPGSGDYCGKPSGVTVTNVNSDNATLNWTMEEGATYSLVMEPLLPMEEGVTSPYLLTGLDPLTTYEVQLFKNCDNGLTSEARTVSFTTTAVAEPVGDAWSDDFEGELGWELINGTCTNAWTVGTAANNGGTHGLYISNDGGTTNAYTITSAAMVYATKLLSFEQGKYEFSFDWIANGESTYDFLRVALVPASVTLTAGTSLPSGLSTTAVPSGWIAVDGGSKLNLSTAWQGNSVAVTLEGGTYYLVFAWRNDTSGGTTPPAAVDNVSITKINCDQDVTNLTVSNITTTGANLTWEGGEATQWQVAYSTNASFEDATEELVPDNASYDIAGLQPATTYYVKVRAYCGGEDFGSWSSVISFPTACEAFTDYPYAENFDSYTGVTSGTLANHILPICWNFINTTTYSSYQGYPFIYNSSSYSNSGNNHLRFYTYYSSYGSYDPQDQYAILPEMEGLNGKQLTLYARGANTNSSFKVGMMTDPMDASTFVEIETTTPTTSYEEYTYTLEGEGNYVAIMVEAANSSVTSRTVYIDDIMVADPPTCAKPQGLAVSDVTNHTATLTWTNGEEGQDAWQISLVQGEEETILDVTENPYTLTDLDASTAYTVMVRTNCGDDGLSYWSTAKNFTTAIACRVPTTLTKTELTAHSAKLGWTETGGATEWVIAYKVTADEEFIEVPVTENPYTLLGLEPSTGYTFKVKAVCGGIDGESNYSTTTTFTTTEECPAPTNLSCVGTTTTTATLSWFGGENDMWDILLLQGSDTIGTYITEPEPLYTVGDLQPGTTYTFKVRTSCGETWSAAKNFTTACEAISQMPYNESFDSYAGSTGSSAPTGYPNHELPSCWQFLNMSETSSTYPQVFVSSSSSYVVSGKCLFFRSSNSTPLYAILPEFAEDIANLELDFTYRNEGTSDYNGTLHVGYMTDPTDASTFTLVETYERTTTLTPVEGVLFADAPAGSYIAFKYEGGTNNNYYLSIDNVKVYNIPTCNKPTNLTVDLETVTAHTATLSWTSEDGQAWDIYLEQNGDELNGGIPVTENPYTLTGLEAESTYLVKVRTDCSSDNNGWSEWSNEVEFTTPVACPAPTNVAVEYNGGTTAVVTWEGPADASFLMNLYGVSPVVEPILVTSPYTLENLELATRYTVQLMADCGEEGMSDTATAVVFTTDLCMPEDMCEITFELTDSYGDGWNGNAIKVVDVETGNVLGQFANTNEADGGEAQTYTLSVCDGREISFEWVSGSYANETSYAVYDVNGEEIFSGEGALSNPVTYTVDCTVPTCPRPKNLAYSVNADGVTISWTGESENYFAQLGVNIPEVLGTVDFEDQTIPQMCENDTLYPWTVVAGHGGYYIQSGNAGVASSTSAISFVGELNADGAIEFDALCMGEGSSTFYDHCDFTIDGERVLYAGANIEGWNHYKFDVPAGEHTFAWSYTKDGSVDKEGDLFAIDNVTLSLTNITWVDAEPATGTSHNFDIDAAGEYCVRVQSDCGEEVSEWSNTLFFNYTPATCVIVLNEENDYTWTENFDSYTSVTTPCTEVEPTCWTWNRLVELPEDYADTLPHLFYKSSFAHSGDYSLRLWNRGTYAMPILDESINLRQVKMSFYVRQSYPFYSLLVGVMTNPNDPTTFEPVAYVDNGNSTSVKYFEFDFSACESEGRYIAFKNVRPSATSFDGVWNDVHSVNYIDDITLSLMEPADCSLEIPYTENFDAITSVTNSITGATPKCWEMVQSDVEEMPFDKKPQLYYSYSSYSGYYSLRMVDRCVYAMPAVNDYAISDLHLSMRVRQPNEHYQLQVGIWEESDGGEGTFVPVALVNNSTTGYVLFECDFDNYDGNGTRIAFRNTLNGGMTWDYSYNYIDNINITSRDIMCESGSLGTETFDNFTSSTIPATGVKPTCWDVVDKDVEMAYDKYPQVYYNADFANSGSYTLRLVDRCVFAMPELWGYDISQLSLSMYLRQPNENYQLEVGVWEFGYDENQEPFGQFVPVATFNNETEDITYVECDFSNYTATVEGSGRIAFRNTLNGGKTWNYSYNYLDDVTITTTEAKNSNASNENLIDEMGVERYLESISVYPNPTVGELHIGATDVQKVECYNQMGQLVAVYNNERDINIRALADGVYTLRITVPQGVTMRKVVKR